MFGRRRMLGVAGGAGAAVFLAACGGSKRGDEPAVREATREAGVIAGGQGQEEQPRAGGTLSFPWAITPALDPVTQTSYQTHQLACFTYPRLYKFKTGLDPKVAQDFQAIPDMAAAMPEITDGGTRYVVRLRTDVKTHARAPLDGRTMNAEDVKVSFEKYRAEPKNANRGAFGTDTNPIVIGVETPDASTVVFKLAKPFAPFLNLIASPAYYWVMPKETGTGFDPAKDMIGGGPFVFEGMQPDISIKFRKHPDYFLKNLPWVDRFDLPIIADPNTRKAQFQAEKLDIFEPTHEDLKDLKGSNAKATIIKYPSRTYPFVFAQLKGAGPFKDERLRQAVSLAIDRDALLRLHWDGEGWWQNIVPVQLGKWWTSRTSPSPSRCSGRAATTRTASCASSTTGRTTSTATATTSRPRRSWACSRTRR
jgi:peptide/nickel transport system substrate-binding protein